MTAITAEQLAEWKALADAATEGPWYVRDFRATEMRRLGWTGPSIDRILITNKTGPEIAESSDADCIVARIQFDNRPEELREGSRSDADLIAAALTAVPALVAEVERLREAIEKLAQWKCFTDGRAIINSTSPANREVVARINFARAALPDGLGKPDLFNAES